MQRQEQGSSGHLFCPGLQYDLGTLILLVAEHAIGLGRAVERQRVADDKGGVDLSLLNAFEQRLHIAHHVGLPCLHGQALVHERAHGKIVDQTGIDAWYGDGSSLLACHNRLSQHDGTVHLKTGHLLRAIDREQHPMTGGLHPNDVHTRVRTLIAGEIMKRLHNISLIEVERFGTGLSRHLQSLGNGIDGDDTSCPQHEAAANRELRDRTAAPDGNRIPLANVAVLSPHVAGWEDVGEEDDLLVRDTVGDLNWPTSAKGTRAYCACPPE
jgi:hypothetical protein